MAPWRKIRPRTPEQHAGMPEAPERIAAAPAGPRHHSLRRKLALATTLAGLCTIGLAALLIARSYGDYAAARQSLYDILGVPADAGRRQRPVRRARPRQQRARRGTRRTQRGPRPAARVPRPQRRRAGAPGLAARRAAGAARAPRPAADDRARARTAGARPRRGRPAWQPAAARAPDGRHPGGDRKHVRGGGRAAARHRLAGQAPVRLQRRPGSARADRQDAGRPARVRGA